MKLESYVEGAWRTGSGVGRDLVDPASGAVDLRFETTFNKEVGARK